MAILLSKAVTGQCRWIVCEPADDKRDAFAGRRVCGAAISWPTSYCLDHRLLVYQRTDRVSAPPADLAIRAARSVADIVPELTEIFG